MNGAPDVTRLRNGIRTVTVPHQDTAASTLSVLFGVGSRHEPARLNGASHYIEHMMFKGTRKRPTTLDISKALDSVGAEYNAFTSKDHTGYFIRLPHDELPLAMDILKDMLTRSAFRQEDLDAERNVILEEIRMYEDNPLMLVDELMEEGLFDGASLARPIAGTAQSMRGIGRKELLAYRDRHYVPQNTVISVAGRMERDDVLRRLDRTFGAMRAGARPRPFRRFTARKGGSGPHMRLRTKDTEQVQVSLGFLGRPYGDRMLPALAVMSTIMGGTMSSRLFTAVRERLGLCYFIRASSTSYQDTGVVDIQAGLAKDGTEKALKVIAREVRRIREKDVSTQELERAKSNLRGRLLLGLEDSSRLAEWYAKQELLSGRLETPARKTERIMRVTKDDVRRAAAAVFRADRCAVAMIGPESDPAPYRAALRDI